MLTHAIVQVIHIVVLIMSDKAVKLAAKLASVFAYLSMLPSELAYPTTRWLTSTLLEPTHPFP